MSDRETASPHTLNPQWFLHHAVLLLAPWQHIEAPLQGILNVSSWSADPDVILVLVDEFRIDDARALRARAYERPLARSHVTFVIAAERMAPEAQNGLLKLFEDPPRTARFILVVPKNSFLLPTLRSRLFVHRGWAHAHTDVQALPDVATITSIADTLKKKPELLHEITEALFASEVRGVSSLRALHTLTRFKGIRGASQKMLIEHALLAHYEDTQGTMK